MAYEHLEGFGSFFVNDKGDNEKRPDRVGSFKLNGKIYRISGWIKESTNGGKPWLSLKVQEDASSPPPPVATDDSIPF
jgi:hypothetical protein